MRARCRAAARLTVEKLNEGGLPLVLSQTFRAIIHSRMRVGMEKYRQQYPNANVVLFEPDREDAQMFFANIFSYRQRKRLCAQAYNKTRRNLQLARGRARARVRAARHLVPPRPAARHPPARHGRGLRPTTAARRSAVPPTVSQTARDLGRTLDALERWLVRAA